MKQDKQNIENEDLQKEVDELLNNEPESQESAESPEDAEATEPEQEQPETPEQRIEALEKRVAELEDIRLRQMAEFDNYRRRTNKEKLDLMDTAGEKLLVDILPLVDDFERARDSMSYTTSSSLGSISKTCMQSTPPMPTSIPMSMRQSLPLPPVRTSEARSSTARSVVTNMATASSASPKSL